jgi:hypothetical protein
MLALEVLPEVGDAETTGVESSLEAAAIGEVSLSELRACLLELLRVCRLPIARQKQPPNLSALAETPRHAPLHARCSNQNCIASWHRPSPLR